jgi:hypothetical protein
MPSITRVINTIRRWGIRVALLALAKQPIPDKLFTTMYVVTKDNADKIGISVVRQPKGCLLTASEIGLIVDVRTIPQSRTNPQYNRETLPRSLSDASE